MALAGCGLADLRCECNWCRMLTQHTVKIAQISDECCAWPAATFKSVVLSNPVMLRIGITSMHN
jgi:hypothetical protein